MSRFPRRGIPDSFGWLRAPKHNTDAFVGWETPAGDIVLLHHEVGTLVQFLPCLAPMPDLSTVKR